MNYHPALLAALIEGHRTHESMTRGGSVSRPLCVDMFGIETVWAMIAVGTMGEGCHLFAAVFAGEGVLGGDEDHSVKGLIKTRSGCSFQFLGLSRIYF